MGSRSWTCCRSTGELGHGMRHRLLLWAYWAAAGPNQRLTGQAEASRDGAGVSADCTPVTEPTPLGSCRQRPMDLLQNKGQLAGGALAEGLICSPFWFRQAAGHRPATVSHMSWALHQ